jgi:hypothetical protein
LPFWRRLLVSSSFFLLLSFLLFFLLAGVRRVILSIEKTPLRASREMRRRKRQKPKRFFRA